MTSVLVIDDHPIVLQGCRCLLEGAGATVLEALDTAPGYELFCQHRPDVIIIDLAMGENDLRGLSLIKRINSHHPETRILVLSMHDDPIIVASALDAGASGYLLKDSAADNLLQAIEIIQKGNSYIDHTLALRVAFARTGTRGDALAGLTPRELEVLALLAKGKSYIDIAEELDVSYKTVVNTGSHLKEKLTVRDLPALVSKAVHLLAAPR